MKMQLLCVGRLKEESERAVVTRYLQRFTQIARPIGFGDLSIVELAESRAKSADERKVAEAVELRKKIPDGAKILALDERGKSLSSTELASWLAETRDAGVRDLTMIIGGPDGLEASLSANAALQLSFGRMTMPHGLVRAVLTEQLYRAATILTGHPYHRD